MRFPKLARIQPNARIAAFGEKDVWGIFSPLSVMSKVLSQIYSPELKRTLAADQEILVTQGANQGIFAILQTYLSENDEVILIEPYFDIYRPAVTLNGGKIVSVPLRLAKKFDTNINANDWRLDFAELESKITEKTKFILLNTPHNPTGKNFELDELNEIAKLAIKYDLVVISDEVYDRIYYETPHLRIATLPGMWERTITVGSAGKTFGVTGWRIGWLIAPGDLLKSIVATHARSVFCSATPIQEGVARGLELAIQNGYLQKQRDLYKKQRDRLISIFGRLGLPVAVTQGSYFLMVNTEKIKVNSQPVHWEESSDPSEMEPHDYTVCRWLTTVIGVTAIPTSSFYDPQNRHLAKNLARFCFCKTDETLDEAEKRLMKLKEFIE